MCFIHLKSMLVSVTFSYPLGKNTLEATGYPKTRRTKALRDPIKVTHRGQGWLLGLLSC